VGAVIPNTILEKIYGRLETVGRILSLVTKTNIKGGMSVPINLVKPVATWVAQGQGSDRQKSSVAQITFGYYKLRCAVSMSLEVATVTLDIFEARLVEAIGSAFVLKLEEAIIKGTGVGQPTGILSTSVTGGASIDGAPAYSVFLEAEGTVPVEYDANLKIVMHKASFFNLLAETDENNQPIARVDRGIDGKPSYMLLGREVVFSPALPTYTAAAEGQVWAFLLDFSDYILNTNYAIGIKRYEDNDTDDTILKTIMLVDGKLVDAGSLVRIKKAMED